MGSLSNRGIGEEGKEFDSKGTENISKGIGTQNSPELERDTNLSTGDISDTKRPEKKSAVTL